MHRALAFQLETTFFFFKVLHTFKAYIYVHICYFLFIFFLYFYERKKKEGFPSYFRILEKTVIIIKYNLWGFHIGTILFF